MRLVTATQVFPENDCAVVGAFGAVAVGRESGTGELGPTGVLKPLERLLFELVFGDHAGLAECSNLFLPGEVTRSAQGLENLGIAKLVRFLSELGHGVYGESKSAG